MQPGDPTTDYFFIGNPQRPTGGFFERLAFLGTVPILDATVRRSDTDRHLQRRRPHLRHRLCADVRRRRRLPAVAGQSAWRSRTLSPASSTFTAPTLRRTATIQRRDAVRLHARRGPGCTSTRRAPRQTAARRHTASTSTAVTPSTSRLPARYLPLYQPFVDLGDATGTSALIVPVTDFLSPFTQTIIETGYDRTNYANPTAGNDPPAEDASIPSRPRWTSSTTSPRASTWH